LLLKTKRAERRYVPADRQASRDAKSGKTGSQPGSSVAVGWHHRLNSSLALRSVLMFSAFQGSFVGIPHRPPTTGRKLSSNVAVREVLLKLAWIVKEYFSIWAGISMAI